MPRGFKKKNPFEDLDKEFKETIENMRDEEIRARIAEVTLNQIDLTQNKKLDKDLAEKLAVVKQLGEKYSRVSQLNLVRVLHAKALAGDASDAKIKDNIATSALDEVANQREKSLDMELKSAKNDAKEAGEQYTDGTKMNKLRIAYAHFILEARGKV